MTHKKWLNRTEKYRGWHVEILLIDCFVFYIVLAIFQSCNSRKDIWMNPTNRPHDTLIYYSTCHNFNKIFSKIRDVGNYKGEGIKALMFLIFKHSHCMQTVKSQLTVYPPPQHSYEWMTLTFWPPPFYDNLQYMYLWSLIHNNNFKPKMCNKQWINSF